MRDLTSVEAWTIARNAWNYGAAGALDAWHATYGADEDERDEILTPWAPLSGEWADAPVIGDVERMLSHEDEDEDERAELVELACDWYESVYYRAWSSTVRGLERGARRAMRAQIDELRHALVNYDYAVRDALRAEQSAPTYAPGLVAYRDGLMARREQIRDELATLTARALHEDERAEL